MMDYQTPECCLLGFSVPSIPPTLQLSPLSVHCHFSGEGAIRDDMDRQIVGGRVSRFWPMSGWPISPLNKLLLE